MQLPMASQVQLQMLDRDKCRSMISWGPPEPAAASFRDFSESCLLQTEPCYNHQMDRLQQPIWWPLFGPGPGDARRQRAVFASCHDCVELHTNTYIH